MQILMITDGLCTFFERIQELFKRRIAEGVALKVCTHSCAEPFKAYGRYQLLDNGCAFSVRDAIEIQERLIRIDYLARDRVSGSQLILPICPVLHSGVEVLPGARKSCRTDECQIGHVSCETFVQP